MLALKSLAGGAVAAYLVAIGAGIVAAVISWALTIAGATLMAWLFWTKTAI